VRPHLDAEFARNASARETRQVLQRADEAGRAYGKLVRLNQRVRLLDAVSRCSLIRVRSLRSTCLPAGSRATRPSREEKPDQGLAKRVVKFLRDEALLAIGNLKQVLLRSC